MAAGEQRGDHDDAAPAAPARDSGSSRGRVGQLEHLGDSGGAATTLIHGDDGRARERGDDAALAALVGTTLGGRYVIARQIGQGGMGAVFEATHTLIGKKVAVKVLLDKYARRDAIVARLEQEARLASSIGHEHIIDITDFGQTEDGRTFVVMELLDGESLAECLHREGALPEPRVLAIAAQVASALAAAHAKGIVHRDIKPENIFLMRRGDADFVKVVDFGISKSLRDSDPDGNSPRLTQTGMVLGTPLYMSPEQARGDDDLDHRIDVYALGVVMYEAATGRVPFIGSNYLSVISQVISEEPIAPRVIRPELSEDFEAIVLRAIDKDRNHRYADAAAMRADLAAVQGEPGAVRAKIAPPRRARARLGGLRYLMWAAGIAVLVAALVVTMVWMLGDPPVRRGPGLGAAAAAAVVDARPLGDGRPAQAPTELASIPITSTPLGATVFDGDRVVGTTPTAYRTTVRDAEVTLVARLPGHDDAVFSVNPIVDRGRSAADPVLVTLTPTATGAGSASTGSGTPRPIDKHRPPRGDGRTTGSGAAGSASVGGVDAAGGGDLQGNPYRRAQGSAAGSAR